MAATEADLQTRHLGWELFVAALSVLSIVNLALGLFVHDPNLQTILQAIDLALTPVFLGDFAWRLLSSRSKSDYFLREFGWADLLSSFPFPNTKILRVFRLWRVWRFVRVYGASGLWRNFLAHRADNALLTVVFLVFCVVEFGALAVLSAERASPDANITSARDAIWWTYVTITTVGYGDHYPVTNVGRFVGMLVMTAGVGLFGTLSGFLANKLLTPPESKSDAHLPPPALDDPRARIAMIRQLLEDQERAIADLAGRLEEVERSLPAAPTPQAER